MRSGGAIPTAARVARRCGAAVASVRFVDRRGAARRQPAPAGAHSRDPARYDVVVIGAGLCGLIFLKYAREQGLRCVALDKQPGVGGLWNRLPAWQDIQNRREDFAIDGIPLTGVTQPAVLEHAHAWVARHDLAGSIALDREVTSLTRADGRWHVGTADGTYEADHVVVATGTQNEPWIPDVERSRPAVRELHSSQLERPQELAGRAVTVVGGGASGWDLLDLALTHGARQIDWVYRNPRWFLPTRRSKQAAWPNLRELATVQCVVRSSSVVSAFLQGLVKSEYARFGLRDIEPAEAFDVRRHMLNPGRSRMVAAMDEIVRHRTEIRAIEGATVVLEDGVRFRTDVLVWATGYRMDLRYLDLPEYHDVRAAGDLLPKLGALVRSADHPNLFFLGMTLAEATGSTPFFAAVESKSIVSHILGRCVIPTRAAAHQVTHWHLFRHFARFDRATYPRGWWRLKYGLQAAWYAALRTRSIRV